MRWPRGRRAGGAIEIRDDLALWRSDFDEPLPPVTRNELLNRLGLEVDEPDAALPVSLRMPDAKAVAAA